MERDAKITYMGWNNIDLVEGTMLYMTNPGFFQQAVQWLDESGNQIRYATLYHNGFPKPAAARRGGGAPACGNNVGGNAGQAR